ncbi:MAG: T9SS type A sorting domain-containing protein, partial [Candidatus Marinimicrobia bacterium]|nr:T9SS type A sorting domain-containing protein [Candidatus Neomarinimicrobiota bacterium]
DAYLDLLICSFQSVMPPDNIWTLEGIFPYSDGSLDYGVVLMMGGAGFRRYGVGFHLFIGDNIGTVSRLIGYQVGDEAWGDIDIITSLQDEPIAPASFQLTAYPNPFNPSTNIRYALPENSRVEIIIYDQLGRQVNTLVNGQRTAGDYALKWNGTDVAGRQLSSGLYFCQIRAGGFTRTVKLVLLK